MVSYSLTCAIFLCPQVQDFISNESWETPRKDKQILVAKEVDEYNCKSEGVFANLVKQGDKLLEVWKKR